ncbi:NADH dehydrogenase [ubiquinone] 1 beta subcomplex subunit 6-like [Pteronotus mesoamericanus]|uniref:NADH dehydrogenase [ubiquinone] 1 beta subcomplex subunit 6-like n=1 Tax=Pteronotus mesoamericanus TaxID=1884717 RepID=UPI0023EABCD4|nr:NADH dehydrogenase [ubiquinone] 1 beta subcomplex subunit 6-like [Pteronotus parnellii mesoamericanus]
MASINCQDTITDSGGEMCALGEDSNIIVTVTSFLNKEFRRLLFLWILFSEKSHHTVQEEARLLYLTGARLSDQTLVRGRTVSVFLGTGGDRTGYTPDEKLRRQQLRELRRRWLKGQELSPGEPVLPPQRVWPMERFWNKVLQDQAPWKNLIYKTYRHSFLVFTHILTPAWIVHYYLKYHVNKKPYAIVERKPRIFLGDTILETGEVIPPIKEFPDQHH